MTLRQARCLFSKLKAEFEVWIGTNEGWEFNESEGFVADTDAADGDYDGPHKNGGAHYTGTGCDLNLFVNGVYIAFGSHPAYLKFGAKWKSMHPLCRWGGDFDKPDANHISIEFGGRA